MELAHLITFNIALFAIWCAPGPALIFTLRTALAEGRLSGIASGVGLAFVASLWTLAALLGLDIIFTLFPALYTIVKLAGALYLLWLAWNTWRTARDPIPEASSASTFLRAFRQGMMVNALNPKSVLFAAATVAVIFPPLTTGESAIIMINHFFLEVFLYTTLSVIMASPPIARVYLSLKPWFDRLAATVMAALGLRLLWQRG
ncbi:MAG: LysE family translocator [Candidatus Halichondribacter symbioticus]